MYTMAIGCIAGRNPVKAATTWNVKKISPPPPPSVAGLRILAMYGAKSVNTQAIKNLNDTFLTKGP